MPVYFYANSCLYTVYSSLAIMETPIITTKQILKVFWYHARKYKYFVFLSIVTTIFASGLNNVVAPLFYKKFFDTLALTGDIETIASTLISIILIILLIN